MRVLNDPIFYHSLFNNLLIVLVSAFIQVPMALALALLISDKSRSSVIFRARQECGDGKNDWRYCRYVWTLMKHYLGNGASVYDYWNISLKQGGISRWGWAQNSLVPVDTEAKTFRYNFEYYLLKHLSHFVRPGAKRLDIRG